jgi:hypothetical protein
MQPGKEKWKLDIDFNKLNEMFLAGVTFVKIAEELGTTSEHCQHLISKERQKDPDSWPHRRPRSTKQFKEATKSFFERTPTIPIIATRPPLKPNGSPMNTECTKRDMTPEERKRLGVEVPD